MLVCTMNESYIALGSIMWLLLLLFLADDQGTV